MNRFKAHIKNRKLLLGSWLQFPDVFAAEIMAKAGFDWLAIDMEHGLIGMESVFRLIQIIDLSGVVPLVRLNTNDASTIRRVMDAGSRGVIVPMVNSADDAQRAVRAVKYPPEGSRSFGLGRAHDYGRNFKKYTGSANDDSIVIIQIEHINAVQNIGSILDIDGIDGVFVGPYDLSGSMGIPGEFENKDYKETLRGLIKEIKKTKKAMGFHIVHPSEKELKEKVAEGFSFIGYGTDSIFLTNGVLPVRGLKKSAGHGK